MSLRMPGIQAEIILGMVPLPEGLQQPPPQGPGAFSGRPGPQGFNPMPPPQGGFGGGGDGFGPQQQMPYGYDDRGGGYGPGQGPGPQQGGFMDGPPPYNGGGGGGPGYDQHGVPMDVVQDGPLPQQACGSPRLMLSRFIASLLSDTPTPGLFSIPDLHQPVAHCSVQRKVDVATSLA